MDAAPTVRLNDDEVRGTWSDGIARFRGIPYATAERFAPPVPVTTWGDLDAAEFGPIAPQVAGAQFQRADFEQDEQCLSLNVWTPSADDAGRPIMVWIHGGAFRTGSGRQSALRGHDAGGPRGRGGDHHQLPPRPARVPRPPRPRRRR